jgi:excisionase family DNA binding protein
MFATQAPRLLRISEAAERLNVSRASVYRWIDEGRLPAVQLGGRGSPLRIPAGELQEWLALSHISPAERRAPVDLLPSGSRGAARAGRDRTEVA